MTNYKRQHFVPKFYLKHFSIDGQIQIYNIKLKRFYESPYGSVCARDYFYSRIPECERSFSQLESEWNRILRIIIQGTDLNELTNLDYALLNLFITFQHSRTKSGKMEVERHFNELTNYTYKPYLREILKDLDIEPKSIDKWKIASVGPHHAFYMNYALKCAPILIPDLKSILFINRTKRDFIMSDSPVILYNSFFNYPEGPGTAGLQSPGLQIFCPLSPKMMLVFYDKSFYYFKNILNNKVHIELECDVDALNSLQFFSSEYIIFADGNDTGYVKKLHKSLEDFLVDDYFRLEKLSINSREIIMTYIKDIDYILNLSFMIFKPCSGAVDIARDFNLAKYTNDNFNFEEDYEIERLFYLGEVAVSSNADKALFLEDVTEDLKDILKRHVSGDWGEVSDEIKERNNKAVDDGSCILSAYTLSSGKKILVRTEAANPSGNRNRTNILIPEEEKFSTT